MHIGSSHFQFNESVTEQMGGLPITYLDGDKKSVMSNAVTVKDWSGANEQLRVLRVGLLPHHCMHFLHVVLSLSLPLSLSRSLSLSLSLWYFSPPIPRRCYMTVLLCLQVRWILMKR